VLDTKKTWKSKYRSLKNEPIFIVNEKKEGASRIDTPPFFIYQLQSVTF
jgi:hypothetical protein